MLRAYPIASGWCIKVAIPPFIDSAHAAELLHISPEAVLDLISEGKLTAYAGPPAKPFLRSRDVMALVDESGSTESAPVTGKRAKSGYARVQARLTADARWSDIGPGDVEAWLKRSDSSQRLAAKKVALETIARLKELNRMLEGGETATTDNRHR